jgi:hypothetical protein
MRVATVRQRREFQKATTLPAEGNGLAQLGKMLLERAELKYTQCNAILDQIGISLRVSATKRKKREQ